MSAKFPSLQKRLAKVDRRLADIARREELANCNCRRITVAVAGRAEEFEAETNVPCPAHGLRRLGAIVCAVALESENDEESVKERMRQENSELDRVLVIYEARLAQQDSQKLEEGIAPTVSSAEEVACRVQRQAGYRVRPVQTARETVQHGLVTRRVHFEHGSLARGASPQRRTVEITSLVLHQSPRGP